MQLDDLFPPGRVFGGDYRIQRFLKAGGVGSVFVAEQLSTERECALKILRPSAEDARFREHWETEAKASARIRSDHVVRVLAAGIEHTGTKETPWIAMELLEGQDFADLLAARGRLQPREVDGVVKEVCHALGLAHEIGIVHRDLKPENLFLARPRTAGGEPIVKILDFGIAKMVKARRTGTARMGTLGWLAPEQTRRKGEITPATDVWALGLIVFMLYTGKSYWLSCQHPNDEDPDLFFPELITEPLVPASLRAAELACAEHLPRWFDGWFARCVTRGERFADASAAYAAFVEASNAKPVPVSHRPPPPPVAVSHRPPPPPVAVSHRPPPPSVAVSHRPPPPPVPVALPAPTLEQQRPLAAAVTHPSIKAFETSTAATSPDDTAPGKRKVRRAAVAGFVALSALAWWLAPSEDFGELTITSDLPVNSIPSVFVDDQLVCTAFPCTIRELARGSHVVFAKADGYTASARTVVQVERGEKATVRLSLEAAPATLEVASDPPGARVRLDGTDLGTAPRTLSGLVPNQPHQLRLELDEFEIWERTLTLKPGQHLPLDVPLVRRPQPQPTLTPKAAGVPSKPQVPEPPKPEARPKLQPLALTEAQLDAAVNAAYRACQSQLRPQDSGTLAQFQLAVSPAGVATVTPSAVFSTKQPYADCFVRALRSTAFQPTLMGAAAQTRKFAL